MSSIEFTIEPRLIEAIATADDLPAQLKQALGDTPGQVTSGILPLARRMSPELSYGRHAGPAPATARSAAVMLLLFRRGGRWHLPLTQRPAAMARHGGQISLPGGTIEPAESPADAACRELAEELGVNESIEMLGRLPDRYVYASDYIVKPHVGYTEFEPNWRPDIREVERVVELPLELLFNAKAVGQITINRGPLVFHAPCYVHRDDRVWGATSVILAELADVLLGIYPSTIQALPRTSDIYKTIMRTRFEARMEDAMEQPPRVVVFDLDGLIANTEDLYELAGDEILNRRGKTHDHELRVQMMGRPVADSFRIMIEYHGLSDTLDELIVEVEELLARHMATSLVAMPGLHGLLNALDAGGMPIAIATSGTRSYATNVLTRLGLVDRFRFILTAEDIQRGKPDPEIYLLAASRLQIPPSAMMVLEDSGNGCRAAVAAGAFAVAVPNRHTRAHNFDGASLVADTLADPRILAALRLAR